MSTQPSKKLLKQKYRVLCAKEPSIPIFSKDWWLDAVAGDAWGVVLVEKGDRVLAALPYVRRKRFGLNTLSMPALTQTLGPWLRASEAKYSKRISQEKELLQKIYSMLPHYHYYNQNWNYKLTNWLPLYWLGFEQTTRYTYRLDDLTDIDALWKNLDTSVRGHVRRAAETLHVVRDLPFENFIELNRKVFDRQALQLPYSEELLWRIDKACKENNSGTCFYAVDNNGQIHAALYLIWDANSSYSLMSGSDAKLRSSGAISLLRWESIKFSSKVTKSFDFEGSMIERVEQFMRAFGAKQTPYYNIRKVNSILLDAYFFLKKIK